MLRRACVGSVCEPGASRWRRGVWALALLALVACAEDQPPAEAPPEAPAAAGLEAARVGAEPVPARVVAGEAVTFPCEAPMLAPMTGWEGTGAARWPQRAGRYTWRCDGAEGALEVAPGEPVEVVWSGLEAPVIARGASLDVQAWREDRFDNRVATLEVRVTPPEAARREGDRLRFIAPGALTFEALGDDGWVVASRALRVDAGPPQVVIEAPARGAVIDAAASPTIEVRGRVSEDGPEVTLTVNGAPVTLSDDGRFSHVVTPARPGLVVIGYRAEDALGQALTGATAALHGRLRDPMAGLERAARIFLPASLLDDDDAQVDDLARAAELMLGALSVPDQRVALKCGGWVHLKNVRWEPAEVDLEPLDRRLGVAVTLRDVAVDFDGRACMCAWGARVACADFAGSVASSRVEAGVIIGVGGASPTSIAVNSTTLDLAPLEIHWDLWDGALDWFVGLFESTVRERLIEVVDQSVSRHVHADLGRLLERALPMRRLDLPPPLDLEVEVTMGLQALVAREAGLTIDGHLALVSTEAASSRALATRTVRASTAPPALPEDRLGVAVALDTLNDALFLIYRRGVLADVAIDWAALDAAPPPGLGEVVLEATLPPLVMPGDAPGEVAVSVGDLRVRATTMLGEVEVYVSFVMRARVGFDVATGEVVLTPVAEGLELYLAPASPEDAASLEGVFSELESLARAAVIEALAGQAVRLLVPAIDLGMIRGVPALAGQRIGLEDAQLTVTPEGYVVATAGVASAP